MDQPRIVMTRHRPRLRAAVIAAVAGVLVIGAVVIFKVTRSLTASDYEQSRSEVQELRDVRRKLTRELKQERDRSEELSDQVAYLERSREIDGEAAEKVRASLVALQAEVAQLREQIAFYQIVASPSESRGGLRVLEGKLFSSDDPRRWRLELVLVQPMQHDRQVRGSLSVEVIGSNAQGKDKTLALAPLLLPDSELSTFTFRYFQQLSAAFELPPDFKPRRLAVTLRPEEGSRRVDNLDWDEIVVTEPSTEGGEFQEPEMEGEPANEDHG